jgi:hypothetical protein
VTECPHPTLPRRGRTSYSLPFVERLTAFSLPFVDGLLGANLLYEMLRVLPDVTYR